MKLQTAFVVKCLHSNGIYLIGIDCADGIKWRFMRFIQNTSKRRKCVLGLIAGVRAI